MHLGNLFHRYQIKFITKKSWKINCDNGCMRKKNEIE